MCCMKTIFIHFRENLGKLWKCVPFLLSTQNSTFLVTGPSKEPLIKPKNVYGRGVNYNIKNYAYLDLLKVINFFPLCVVSPPPPPRDINYMKSL